MFSEFREAQAGRLSSRAKAEGSRSSYLKVSRRDPSASLAMTGLRACAPLEG
jgi:hypothetical protein